VANDECRDQWGYFFEISIFIPKTFPFEINIKLVKYKHTNYLKKLQPFNNLLYKNMKPLFFEIAENDFPIKTDWNTAIAACESLGPGWRLPSKAELREMSNLHQSGLCNLCDHELYWSSEEITKTRAWYLITNHYGDGEPFNYLEKNSKFKVRPVRKRID
jgi:hypothetical protein